MGNVGPELPGVGYRGPAAYIGAPAHLVGLRSALVLSLLACLQACVQDPPKNVPSAEAAAALQATDAVAFAEPYLRHPLAWQAPKDETWGRQTVGSISPTQVGLGSPFTQSPFGQTSLQYCRRQGGDHFWINPDNNGALYWCTDAAEGVAFFGFKFSSDSGLLWINVLGRGAQVTPTEFTEQMTTLYRFQTLAARQQTLQLLANANEQARAAVLRRARLIEESRAHFDLRRGAKVCRYGTMRFGTYAGTFLNQPQILYHEFEGSVEGRIDDLSEDKRSIKVMVTRFVTPPESAAAVVNTPVQMGTLTIPNTQNALVWDDASGWGACVGL